MSDFFSRLAERALGQAETAQPVLAPRFAVPAPVEMEPGVPHPKPAIPPGEPPEVSEQDQPTPITPEDPPNIVEPIRPRPLCTQEPEEESTRAREKSEPEFQPLPAAPPEPANRPLANARGSETAILSRDREGAVFIATVAVPEPDSPAPVNAVKQPSDSPKAPARTVVHPPAVPQVFHLPRVANRAEPPTPPQRTETPEVRMPPAPPQQPQARPEVEMAPPTTRDVSVHIGRIEIRAAPPPAPPAPRPRTTLSLAEYLKVRNGERR